MSHSDSTDVKRLNEALKVMHKRCDEQAAELAKLRAARPLPAFDAVGLLERVERRLSAEMERLRAVVLETPTERTADKVGVTWPRTLLMEKQLEFYSMLERVRRGEALGEHGRGFADWVGHAMALAMGAEARQEQELTRLRQRMDENADEREAFAYAECARIVYTVARKGGVSQEQADALNAAVRAAAPKRGD